MLLEIVTALVKAGRAALTGVHPDGPCEVSVSQLDQGQLSFPSLAVLRLSGHHLRFVHVGADGNLRHQLLDMPDPDARAGGAQIMAESVLEEINEAMPSRYARGRVDHLALAPVSLGTRGVRSFGVRCRADHGQLFLLADVPSVAEIERERGSDVLRRMADSCLSPAWSTDDEIHSGAAEGLADYLSHSESDVHLELPVAGDMRAEKAAILVAMTDSPEGRRLDFAVPVDAAMRGRLAPGDPVRGRVGVEDRSVEFNVICRSMGVHSLPSGLQMVGISTSLPMDVRVVQSRRSFRIPLPDPLDAEIDSPDPGVGAVGAQVLDLSFNGARLVTVRGDLEPSLAAGDAVLCRLHLNDGVGTVEIPAVVRRTSRTLDEAARPSLEIGLEFDGPGLKGAAARIRKFVLDQQRCQLARRVQVARVGDW